MLRSTSGEIITKLNDIYKVYPVIYMYVDYSLNSILLIKAYDALYSWVFFYHYTLLLLCHYYYANQTQKIIIEYNK